MWRLLRVLVTDELVVNSMVAELLNVALARPINKGGEHEGFQRQLVPCWSQTNGTPLAGSLPKNP